MGEVLQDSRCYILQWWDNYYDTWHDNRCYSLKEAKQDMARLKVLDNESGVKVKYRIIKETTKREVIYND